LPIDVAGTTATRLAKAATDLLWWVALAFSVILVILFLLSPVLLKNDSGVNTVAVQVSFGDPAHRTVPLDSPDTPRASDVVLTERDTTHHLEFHTTDWALFVMVNWVFLPLLTALLFGVHLLRSFLADVLAADVFTRRNAGRLSRLGWLAIGLGIAGPALEYWRSSIVLARTQLETFALTPATPEWEEGSVLSGLLLLVLASAWRYGAELQQERDLTV
jgi:Protein of unknown function (DUF2975)